MAVGTFGEKLRRERESRKITLDEIAEATKIGTRSLRALEEEHFDQLPGGIFNKGFVRSYARYLGIDEDQAVADYLAATGEQQTAKVESFNQITRQLEEQQQREREAQRSERRSATMWLVIVVLVLVALAVGGWRYLQQRKAARLAENADQTQTSLSVANAPAPTTAEAATPAAMNQSSTDTAKPGAEPSGSTTSAAPATPQPAVTSASAPATTSAPTPEPSPVSQAGPVNLELKATQPAWISVKVDGKFAESGTLDPATPEQARRTFHANDKIQLVVGNAAGLEVTLNGKPVGSLGPEGKSRKVVFTAAGMQVQP